MQSINFEWLFLKVYDFFFTKKEVIASAEKNFSGLINFFIVLLVIISVFFLAIIIYSVSRMKERSENQKRKFETALARLDKSDKETEKKEWKMVLDFITSSSPSDWRVAIIECDNMLDDLTKKLGLIGENLGERLKNASPDHFKTLNNAWEAHKVRNKIAHEGVSYEISYREAKRAIELYESVFEEFDFI